MKDWYKSRTVWVAIGQGVLGVVVALAEQHPGVGGLLILKAALDLVLRAFTDKPIV